MQLLDSHHFIVAAAHAKACRNALRPLLRLRHSILGVSPTHNVLMPLGPHVRATHMTGCPGVIFVQRTFVLAPLDVKVTDWFLHSEIARNPSLHFETERVRK